MNLQGINLIVKDIDKQKDFYQNILGLELVSDYGDAVFFRAGEIKLGLFAKGHHMEGDKSLEGANKGISHLEFGISSDEIDELEKTLKDRGYFAYKDNYKDADGNLFHFNPDDNMRF